MYIKQSFKFPRIQCKVLYTLRLCTGAHLSHLSILNNTLTLPFIASSFVPAGQHTKQKNWHRILSLHIHTTNQSPGLSNCLKFADPLINFKLKQRFVVLGTAVTVGADYLSDLAHWRSYCAIEDTLVKGRFSLRGSELGWAKAWVLNLGQGEENAAKFKLRLGLNLKTFKAYAKLRFRTEPISPFDIGEGVSCAGKVPVPMPPLPLLRSVPLRIEYIMRINTAKPNFNKKVDKERKVFFTTGVETIDLSLDELNFCLEWDEHSPVWNIGLVKSEPDRKQFRNSGSAGSPFSSFRTSSAVSAGMVERSRDTTFSFSGGESDPEEVVTARAIRYRGGHFSVQPSTVIPGIHPAATEPRFGMESMWPGAVSRSV